MSEKLSVWAGTVVVVQSVSVHGDGGGLPQRYNTQQTTKTKFILICSVSICHERRKKGVCIRAIFGFERRPFGAQLPPLPTSIIINTLSETNKTVVFGLNPQSGRGQRSTSSMEIAIKYSYSK